MVRVALLSSYPHVPKMSGWTRVPFQFLRRRRNAPGQPPDLRFETELCVLKMSLRRAIPPGATFPSSHGYDAIHWPPKQHVRDDRQNERHHHCFARVEPVKLPELIYRIQDQREDEDPTHRLPAILHEFTAMPGIGE